jgi:hypothetical protein
VVTNYNQATGTVTGTTIQDSGGNPIATRNANYAITPDGNGGFTRTDLTTGATQGGYASYNAAVPGNNSSGGGGNFSSSTTGSGASAVTTNTDNANGTTFQTDSTGALTTKGAGDAQTVSGSNAKSTVASSNTDDSKYTGSDKCKYAGIDSENLNCNGTENLMKGAVVMDQIAQMGASAATNIAGQSAQIQAQTQGTQSAALQGAADTARMTGDAEIATGTLNAGMGAMQLQRSMHHSSNADALTADTKAGVGALQTGSGSAYTKGSINQYMGAGGIQGAALQDGTTKGDAGYLTGKAGYASKIVTQGQMDTDSGLALKSVTLDAATAMKTGQAKTREEQIVQRQADYDKKANIMGSTVKRIGSAAAGEQKAEADAAMMGGMMSMMKGLVQAGQGAANLIAANAMDQAAATLAGTGPGGSVFQPTLGNGPIGPGDPLAPPGSNAISGDGANPSPTAGAADAAAGPDPGGLGNGFATPQANNGSPGPAAGGFGADPSGGGAGGGGGGFGGGDSTAAAQGGTDDPQAKMAAAGAGGGYDTGGTFVGGGGGGRGGGADSGPDLSGLLAQFLPKKGDEDKQKDILDFEGQRGPAGQGPISLLDKNVNIFMRIHETYQDKNRNGAVKF